MLSHLYIKDFGIIEKAMVNLTRGLNVLTGETGSGKSIIIEAIQLVTGGRAISEYIRAGCDRAVVQAAVETGDLDEIKLILSDGGISDDQDGQIILTREINRNGRNQCRINGQMVTLGLYREVGRLLVDIQGQHDQQMLLDPERQLYLLDAYGGEETAGAAARLAGLHRRCRENTAALKELRLKATERAGRRETINYQINEIDSASLRPGEDGELETERRKLVNAGKISSLLEQCYRQIYGGGGADTSSLEMAGNSLKLLDRLAEMDGSLSSARDMVAAALYQMEEAARELAAYADGLEFYPARLEFVEERLDFLNGLKRKYGLSIEGILDYRKRIALEMEEMDGGEQRLEQLERDLKQYQAQLELQAGILTGMRKRAAAALEDEIARELKELEMPGAVFSIVFSDREQISEKGLEKAEFFISTNPGEPARPLSKVVSGGETSRLMLAVYAILAEMQGIPTLVFDEIDTGIGGRTIRSVAAKLQHLSRKRQVICVTHSPAVASAAQNHLLIRKGESGSRTQVEIDSLDGRGKLLELTRMLGGDRGDGTALNHARQLMEEALSLKDDE